MPSTLLGIVLIGLGLIPGASFHSSLRRRRPAVALVGPTPRFLVSGTVAALSSLIALLVLERIWPELSLTRPEDLVGAEVASYVAHDALAVVATAAVVIGFATMVALLLARVTVWWQS